MELRRTQAYREAQEALTAPQTAQFVEELRLAIAQRDWRVEENMRGEGSARDFASRALTRLRKRLLKKSRDLATLSPEARHQARIALKKARYGAEFFHSLYSDSDQKTARAFLRALSEMQDGMRPSTIWRSQIVCSIRLTPMAAARRRAPRVLCAAGSPMRRGKAPLTRRKAKSG